MRAETIPTFGVAYFGYANGRKWLARQTEEGLRRYLSFHGVDIREGLSLAQTAESVFSSIFMRPGDGREERTVSRWAINVGEETFFDRFPPAVDIFDAINEVVEKDVSGYVADEPGGMDWCTGLTHAFANLSVAVASFKDPKELWWASRALSTAYIDRSTNDYVGSLLEWELERLKIEDDGQSPWKAIGDERGFLPPEEFEAFRLREDAFKSKRNDARRIHAYCFPNRNDRDPFDVDKARAVFDETNGETAVYFADKAQEALRRMKIEEKEAEEFRRKIKESTKSTAQSGLGELRPGSAEAIEKYRSFARAELEAGYSPYGYWFDPDGSYYPMRDYQGHAVWLKTHFRVEYGPDMYDAYGRAWTDGWVLMSMGEDLVPEAVIRYAEDDVSPEALRTAAKMLRRGGMFPGVMIEPHDADAKAVGYQKFDKAGAAAEHLKQLAKEIEDKRDSAPRM